MVVPDDEFAQVGEDARAVIIEAKAAGVYVFAGGISKACRRCWLQPTVRSRKAATNGAAAQRRLHRTELPTYEDAIVWAARIAKACRCEQELRVFQFDPVS
jgi:hypothetical protein